MNAIDKYNNSKQELARFNSWASLIGKEYFGGTRGRGGEYGEVVSAKGNLTIYSQPYDGANNYHDLDKQFLPYLSKAMIQHSHVLIESIRKQLTEEVEANKIEAQKLVAELNQV
jgi:hypothetical protein